MTVDGASETRVDAVMQIFAQDKVDITCYADLIGTSRDDVVANSVMEVKVGTSGFIQRAFVKASKQDQLAQLQLPLANGFLSHAPATPQMTIAPGPDDFAAAMVAVMDRKESEPKPALHINLDATISKIDLSGLPQPVWPKSSAVDQLANDAVKLRKKGIDKPFVCVDIKTFLPSWAENAKAITPKDQPADEDAQLQSKRLDVIRWQAAFDKYAMGAAASEQLNYASALAHKDICMQIALRAPLGATPRRAALGVIYDEEARKSWALRSASGEFSFDVNVAAKVMDPVILRQAEATYDVGLGTPFAGKGKGKDKSKSAGIQCYKCGGFGHIGKDCPKNYGSEKSSDKYCYQCGQYGHVKADCWKGVKRARYT